MIKPKFDDSILDNRIVNPEPSLHKQGTITMEYEATCNQEDTQEHFLELFAKRKALPNRNEPYDVCYVLGLEILINKPNIIEWIRDAYSYSTCCNPEIAIPVTWREDLMYLSRNDFGRLQSVLLIISKAKITGNPHISEVACTHQSNFVGADLSSVDLTADSSPLNIANDYYKSGKLNTYVITDIISVRENCVKQNISTLSTSELKAKLSRIQLYHKVESEPTFAFSSTGIDWGTLLTEKDYVKEGPMGFENFFQKYLKGDVADSVTQSNPTHETNPEVMERCTDDIANNSTNITVPESDFYKELTCITHVENIEDLYKFLTRMGYLDDSPEQHDAYFLRMTGRPDYYSYRDTKMIWHGTNTECSAFIHGVSKDHDKFKRSIPYFIIKSLSGEESSYEPKDAANCIRRKTYQELIVKIRAILDIEK